MFPPVVSQWVNWKSTLMQYASVGVAAHEIRHTPSTQVDPAAQPFAGGVQKGGGRRSSMRHAPLAQ